MADFVDFESCFIEIESAVSGNIIIGILYKPPDTSCVNFIDGFNKILGHVQNENKKCYIMGDFNINLLHHITNEHVQDFIHMLSSNSFVPLINKPTRITPGSATLIDNILTNVLSDHRTGILTTDISDHFPIFAIVHLYTTKKQFDVNYIKHDFSCTNIQHFIQDLHETNWDFITTSDDVNDNYSIYLQFILQ